MPSVGLCASVQRALLRRGHPRLPARRCYRVFPLRPAAVPRYRTRTRCPSAEPIATKGGPVHVRRCLLLALVALFPAMAPVAGAQDATGGGCAVAPRSLDEVLALALAPDGSPAADPDSTLRIAQVGDLPPGDPVDAATVAAIDPLARSYAACLDAGDSLRLVALFTPAMIASFLADTPSREAAAGLLTAPRASATRFVAFGPARDARRLADG